MHVVEFRGVEPGTVTRVRCGMPEGVVDLDANEAMGLRPGGCGLAIRCLSGLLVVTQKGDRKDHELCPGEEFRTHRRGLVVAWALLPSACSVHDGARVEEDAPLEAA